jgi:hypothetical protein
MNAPVADSESAAARTTGGCDKSPYNDNRIAIVEPGQPTTSSHSDRALNVLFFASALISLASSEDAASEV